MSRLDDIKGAYDNIQVPVELKERVLQSMERGKKDACGEKKESGKTFAGKSERNQKKGHLLPFVRAVSTGSRRDKFPKSSRRSLSQTPRVPP